MVNYLLPDDQHFDEALQRWIEVIQRRSMHDFLRFCRQVGLSMGQLGVLMRLSHCGVCGVSDMASHMGITNAAASQMIDRMVQAGLLARNEDPIDRRSRHISLTEDGQAIIEASIQARRQSLARLSRSFTREQRAEILRGLTLLTEAVEASEEVDATPGKQDHIDAAHGLD